MVDALKIFNKLKVSFVLMLLVYCASVAGANLSLANPPLMMPAGVSPQSNMGGYNAILSPFGNLTTVAPSAKKKTEFKRGATKLAPLPKGKSSLFRQKPLDTMGYSALNRETRHLKRALAESQDRLLVGAGIAAVVPGVAVLYTAAPLLQYVGSHVGDALNTAFTKADDLLNQVDKIDNKFVRWAAKTILFAPKVSIAVGKAISGFVFGRSNADCNIQRMESIYRSGCYPCVVVKSLISSFMTAASTMFSVSQEAGNKILPLGLLLWIAFFAIKQVSSFKNIEPSAMVQELLVMGFKVILAYLVVNEAVEFFVSYMITPFLVMGAEFGVNLMAVAGSSSGIDYAAIELDQSYILNQQEIASVIPLDVLNTIMTYIAAADSVTSTHLMIGHMVTCHASRVGAFSIVGLGYIPNIWIWACGAFIWCAGFMMTLSIAYYLIDVSFKLGFSIIALPIAVSLWPFNVTKGKVTACFQIILKSMGIFIFLAMTTAIGLALVSHALNIGAEADGLLKQAASDNGTNIEEMSGTEKLLLAIEDGDAKYVGDAFSIFSGSFLLILFAYLYAIKIIGSTIGDYVNVFFPDGVFGDNNTMHQKLTQATDGLKKKAGKVAKFGGKAAKNMASKKLDSMGGLKGIAGKFGKIKNNVDSLADGDAPGENKDNDKGGSKFTQAKQVTNLEGKDKQSAKNAVETGGATVKNAGKAMEAGAAAGEQAGNIMEKSGKAISDAGNKAGDAMLNAGKGLTSTGVGAIVGVPLAAVGVATKVGATTSGKAMEYSGKMVKQMSKMLKKIAKQMKKAGERVQNSAKKLKGSGGGVMGKIKNAVKENASQKSTENKEQSSDKGIHDNKGAKGSGGEDMMDSITGLDNGKKK